MAYVDLNPIRAKIADSTSAPKHTRIRRRGKQIQGELTAANAPHKPLLGCKSNNAPRLPEGECLALVDFNGRQVYPGKRGRIKEPEASALDKLGLNPAHWTHRVKGLGRALALWRHWCEAGL